MKLAKRGTGENLQDFSFKRFRSFIVIRNGKIISVFNDYDWCKDILLNSIDHEYICCDTDIVINDNFKPS